MYTSCCLGCGPRARGHAEAYAHVHRGRLEAVCDQDAKRLEAFAEKFAIPRRYSSLDHMLEAEKPDLLHIVTQPQLRVNLLSQAADRRVPAVLVEKPLALDAADFSAIRDLGERTDTRICVNHQLRFHPRILELLGTVRDGGIGELRFLEASAGLGLAGQGTHILNLMLAFAGDRRPTRIFAQACGKSQWMGGNHPAPDMAMAEITFQGGLRGLLACGANAPRASADERVHMHKRIAAFGTRGFVHWTMESWEATTPEGGYQSGEKSYREEDVLGQAAMTDAIFEWLEDDSRPHPNRLEVSLAESNTVLGLYRSVIDGRPVELPFQPEGKLLEALAGKL
ncbi:MAG: Gfo/Idh/MocA family protein [Candidatus Brocadiia bacterium]